MFGKKKKPKPRPKTRKVKARKARDPAKAARMQLILGVVAGSLAVLGLIVGLSFLRDRTIKRNTPPIKRVVLENRPDWMDEDTATGICQMISDLAAQDPSDQNLPIKAAARLAQNLWVKRVLPAGVVNDQEGTLSIRCEFRKPIAAVISGEFLVRVDEDAMVLPGKPLPSGLPIDKYKSIRGVISEAPEPGQIWNAPDLLAAVKLLRLIDGHAFSREITAVDVSNYNGRRNAKFHIVMFTDQRTKLNWGKAIGTEGHIEVDYQQKLQHLDGLFAKHGSLNKFLYIDLTGRKPRGIKRSERALEPQ